MSPEKGPRNHPRGDYIQTSNEVYNTSTFNLIALLLKGNLDISLSGARCMLLERKMVSEYQKKDIFWKKNRRRQGQWGSLCLSVGIIVITMKTGRMIDITSGRYKLKLKKM
ncbi:hypothetical protein Tco_1434491 [Tanacetum coccineum]